MESSSKPGDNPAPTIADQATDTAAPAETPQKQADHPPARAGGGDDSDSDLDELDGRLSQRILPTTRQILILISSRRPR